MNARGSGVGSGFLGRLRAPRQPGLSARGLGFIRRRVGAPRLPGSVVCLREAPPFPDVPLFPCAQAGTTRLHIVPAALRLRVFFQAVWAPRQPGPTARRSERRCFLILRFVDVLLQSWPLVDIGLGLTFDAAFACFSLALRSKHFA